MTPKKNDTKKLFLKYGTCSRTFFFILDREFGNENGTAELAADPLVGGILQSGYQCGLLFGAVLGAGAEAHRRSDDPGKAVCMAILAAQELQRSFKKRAGSTACREITRTDFSKKIQMATYLLFKSRACLNMAQAWAPEAIRAARTGLSAEPEGCPEHPLSCASEVVRRMGGTVAQAVTAAGLAGGMGLSGNACGALSAAIWMNTHAFCRDNPDKSAFSNTYAKNTLIAFLDATDGKVLCREICQRRFRTIAEHTAFIASGGCEGPIEALVRS